MARPREFDETTALNAAIDCFWHRGYEATSVRDLAASMGLSGPSLYNAFGDKRALFVRALERYLDCSPRERIKRLEASLPPKVAVRRFIEEIIDRSLSDPYRRGCFLINSALEVAPHDEELRALIADRLGEIEMFFRRSIERGQADGTVPAINLSSHNASSSSAPVPSTVFKFASAPCCSATPPFSNTAANCTLASAGFNRA